MITKNASDILHKIAGAQPPQPAMGRPMTAKLWPSIPKPQTAAPRPQLAPSRQPQNVPAQPASQPAQRGEWSRPVPQSTESAYVGSYNANFGPNAHHMSYGSQLKRNAGANFIHPASTDFMTAVPANGSQFMTQRDVRNTRGAQADEAAGRIAPRGTRQWADAYNWYMDEGANNLNAYQQTGKPVPQKRRPIPSSIPKEQHQQMMNTAPGIAYNRGGYGGSNTAMG